MVTIKPTPCCDEMRTALADGDITWSAEHEGLYIGMPVQDGILSYWESKRIAGCPWCLKPIEYVE